MMLENIMKKLVVLEKTLAMDVPKFTPGFAAFARCC